MKFGATIEANTFVPWRAHYLQYNPLKKLISLIETALKLEAKAQEEGLKAAQEGWGLGCRELVELEAQRGALVVEAGHMVASEALVAREAPRAQV